MKPLTYWKAGLIDARNAYKQTSNPEYLKAIKHAQKRIKQAEASTLKGK